MRIAFLSGGKDCYYALYRLGLGVDLGLVLVYEFPRPSPHTLNLGKTVETILLAKIPVVVAKLSKGREFEETAKILKMLSANTIVAGDVYIEDHLNYMERLAKEVGASLIEPLWGLDSVEVLYKEVEVGIKSLIIGCREGLSRWLGKCIDRNNVDDFIYETRKHCYDPLGEHGEYHTIVVDGPLHVSPLKFRSVDVEDYGDYKILRLL